MLYGQITRDAVHMCHVIPDFTGVCNAFSELQFTQHDQIFLHILYKNILQQHDERRPYIVQGTK